MQMAKSKAPTLQPDMMLSRADGSPVAVAEAKMIDPERVGFGMRLKASREARQLTQDDVAKRFDVNKATVSAWETGRGDPGVFRLRELSKLYKTSSESLLWENAPSNDAMQIAAAFDGLDERKQQTFRTLWMAFLQDAMADERVSHIPPAPPHELDSDFGGLEGGSKKYRGKQTEPHHPAGNFDRKSSKEG